jgi:hypothetical protein
MGLNTARQLSLFISISMSAWSLLPHDIRHWTLSNGCYGSDRLPVKLISWLQSKHAIRIRWVSIMFLVLSSVSWGPYQVKGLLEQHTLLVCCTPWIVNAWWHSTSSNSTTQQKLQRYIPLYLWVSTCLAWADSITRCLSSLLMVCKTDLDIVLCIVMLIQPVYHPIRELSYWLQVCLADL